MPRSTLSTLGPYALEAELGRGGMGIVYRAVDTRLGRPVALKVVHRNVADAIGMSVTELRARLRHEAQLAARILHPNVVTVFAYDEVDDDALVAMELVHGPTLADLQAQGHRFTPVDAAALLAQAADGVAAAHALGIVHRDLKPANLMLAPDGRCKVLDFGIAKATSADATPSVSRVTFGTVQYMAPEQVLGRPVTPATDVWALGVILYELITGTAAFGDGAAVTIGMRVAGEEPPYLADAGIASQVFGSVIDVLRSALRKRAEERFADSAAFAAALRVSVGLPPVVANVGFLSSATGMPGGATVSTSSGPVAWTPVSGPVSLSVSQRVNSPVSAPLPGAPSVSGPVRAPTADAPINADPPIAAAADRALGAPASEARASATRPDSQRAIDGMSRSSDAEQTSRRTMTTALTAVVIVGLVATASYLWSGGTKVVASVGVGAGGGPGADIETPTTSAPQVRPGGSAVEARASSGEPADAPGSRVESVATAPPSSGSRIPPPAAVPPPSTQTEVTTGPPKAAGTSTPSVRSTSAATPNSTPPTAPTVIAPPAVVLPRLRPQRATLSLTQGDTVTAALESADLRDGVRVEWRRESGSSVDLVGGTRFAARGIGESRFVPVAVAPSGESLAGESVTFTVNARARAEVSPPSPPTASSTPSASTAVAAVSLAEIEVLMTEAARRAPDRAGASWPSLVGFVMPTDIVDAKNDYIRKPRIEATRILESGSSGTRFETTMRVEVARFGGTTKKRTLVLIGQAASKPPQGAAVVIQGYRVEPEE